MGFVYFRRDQPTSRPAKWLDFFFSPVRIAESLLVITLICRAKNSDYCNKRVESPAPYIPRHFGFKVARHL